MLEFLKLVQQMRLFQKKYTRTKKGEDMIHMNDLSSQVDTQVELLIREHTKKKFERQKPSDEVMDVFSWIILNEKLHVKNGETHGAISVELSRRLAQIGIDIDAYRKSKGK